MQISYEQKKKENYCWHSTQFQEKPKQPPIATETSKQALIALQA